MATAWSADLSWSIILFVDFHRNFRPDCAAESIVRTRQILRANETNGDFEQPRKWDDYETWQIRSSWYSWAILSVSRVLSFVRKRLLGIAKYKMFHSPPSKFQWRILLECYIGEICETFYRFFDDQSMSDFTKFESLNLILLTFNTIIFIQVDFSWKIVEKTKIDLNSSKMFTISKVKHLVECGKLYAV